MGKDDPLAEINRLEKEVAMWKANHADMVNRNAILRDRPDLPVDRLGAYERARQEAAKECIAIISDLVGHDGIYEKMLCAKIKRRFFI